MALGSKLKRRRDRLWKQDPRCKICGVETLRASDVAQQYGAPKGDLGRHVPEEVMNKLATIDHEFNRFDPERHVKMNRERTRLVCRGCNTERGIRDYNALPIETRQIMSGRTPWTLPSSTS